MTEKLHIVCLDAPSPPEYGGAIDMYYKIQSLAEIGKKITLHYFNYNPSRNAAGLEAFCSNIFTYSRKNIFQTLPFFYPHIIQSRINAKLIERLNADDAPITLEGLHCAGIIPSINHSERIVLRMHNEEAAYYRHLAQAETSFFKNQYFRQESLLLQRFQQHMSKEVKLACLSESDIETFERLYGFHSCHFVPCFIPWQSVSINEGRGEFCLYHGNMSVSENEEAALWLIENVFSKIKCRLVIAGKGISGRLAAAATPFNHIQVKSNPPMAEVDALVRTAHIHVLPSLNRTGVKLKLLNALLNGRFCITNDSGVMGSRISDGVHIANEPAQWINYIETTMSRTFGQKEMQAREKVLALYNNRENALRFNALWSHCQ